MSIDQADKCIQKQDMGNWQKRAFLCTNWGMPAELIIRAHDYYRG